MNLNGSKSRIVGLSKELSIRWANTRTHWRDARAAEFERRFMSELSPRVNQAVAAVEKLDEIFQRIKKECE
jgi:hypothetical protein